MLPSALVIGVLDTLIGTSHVSRVRARMVPQGHGMNGQQQPIDPWQYPVCRIQVLTHRVYHDHCVVM
jgi:hypothetical protein